MAENNVQKPSIKEKKEGKLIKKEREQFLKELSAYLQEKGIIWGPSPEIYGGLSGFYTYGPLGKALKNQIENEIRKVFSKYNFWEVECPTIMPRKVWEASGHLGGFTDLLITCSKCGAHFRVDKLIEEQRPDLGELHLSPGEFLELIKKEGITCPSCKGPFKEEIKEHNLMMKTTVGIGIEAYNRPETATTTYLPFLRYFDYFRKKIPFGVFQIGKAYRNEISPRQLTLRMREFTQAEGQLFIFKDQKNNFEKFNLIKDLKGPFWTEEDQKKGEDPQIITFEEARKRGYLKNDAYAFTLAVAYQLYRAIGIKEENLRLRQHHSDEKAFYADDAWDIEVKLRSFGWEEMCGVHDRTDYDLTQHEKFSGKELGVSDENHKKEKPHVLEIAFGTDRMLFSLLDNNYDPKAISEGKNTLRLPYNIAPISTAVFPLMKKEELKKKARELFEKISGEVLATYDEAGSIGRRYLRASEAGIPYAITVDYETLEKGTVTIRDRDTEEQIRIGEKEVVSVLRELLRNPESFQKMMGEKQN